MENEWSREKIDGCIVKVKIEPVYVGQNKIPDSITVTYKIGDEDPVRYNFENVAGGKK